MPVSNQHRRTVVSAALALVLACMTPVLAQAKDDDSSAVIVPAAACSEIAAATSARSSLGGAFAVQNGAAATLICPLPTDDLDSDDSAKPVTFQVSYSDNDGPGGAEVSVQLVRTKLAANAPGYEETKVCGWTSANGGPTGGTTASFVCKQGLAKGGFYHLLVSLTSIAGTSAAAFIGVAADD
jgi:hypothetical protein